jgi:hypothetical protein
MTSLFEDLKRYEQVAGPEPMVDIKQPDYAGQYRRWREWWMGWYAQPLHKASEAAAESQATP